MVCVNAQEKHRDFRCFIDIKSIAGAALNRPSDSLTAAVRICHIACSFSNFISPGSMDIDIYRLGIKQSDL